MEKDTNLELREKLTNGISKAIKKMIERSAKLGEEVVISRNGNVVRVLASELL